MREVANEPPSRRASEAPQGEHVRRRRLGPIRVFILIVRLFVLWNEFGPGSW